LLAGLAKPASARRGIFSEGYAARFQQESSSPPRGGGARRNAEVSPRAVPQGRLAESRLARNDRAATKAGALSFCDARKPVSSKEVSPPRQQRPRKASTSSAPCTAGSFQPLFCVHHAMFLLQPRRRITMVRSHAVGQSNRPQR
jgi:hypothetical protein